MKLFHKNHYVGKNCTLCIAGDLPKEIHSIINNNAISITITDANAATDIAPLNQIKVIAYKDKNNWTLETKYNIGKKKAPEPTTGE